MTSCTARNPSLDPIHRPKEPQVNAIQDPVRRETPVLHTITPLASAQLASAGSAQPAKCSQQTGGTSWPACVHACVTHDTVTRGPRNIGRQGAPARCTLRALRLPRPSWRAWRRRCRRCARRAPPRSRPAAPCTRAARPFILFNDRMRAGRGVLVTHAIYRAQKRKRAGRTRKGGQRSRWRAPPRAGPTWARARRRRR